MSGIDPLGAAPTGTLIPRALSFAGVVPLGALAGGGTEWLVELTTRRDVLRGEDLVLPPAACGTAPTGLPGPGWSIPPSEAVLRFSRHGWIGEPEDALQPNSCYPARLLSEPMIERRLPVRPLDPRRVGAQHGTLEILAADGSLDEILARRAVGGQPVRILRGPRTRPRHARYSSFGLLASCVAEGWTQERGRVVVSLRDSGLDLERLPAARRRYLGSGLGEGPPEMEGRPMPLSLGPCPNVRGDLVDAASRMYRFHQGPAAISELRDRAVVLPRDTSIGTGGDFATPEALAAAADSITAGYHATCEAEALACLHFENEGGYITADVAGAGGAEAGHAEALLWLLDGVGWSQRLDLASFDSLPAGAAGWHWGGDQLDGLRLVELIEEVLTSCYGWAAVGRAGHLSVGPIEPLGSSAGLPEIGPGDLAGEPVPLEQPGPPFWRVVVAYERNWTVQEGGELVDDLPAAEQQRWARRWRSDAVWERPGLRLQEAEEVLVPAGWRDRGPAAATAERIGQVAASTRVILAPTWRRGFAFEPGAAVVLRHPRYALGGGWPARVIGTSERGGQVDLLLLGRRP